MSNYIAILSSTHPCSERNKAIASETGKEIVLLGFSLAAGNLSGTPKYAFQSDKQNNGITLAIIEQTQHFYDHQYCDILEVVPNIDTKHKMLTELYCGAIVIGNDPGTVKLIELFLEQEKPVVVIKNTSSLNSKRLGQTTRNNTVKHYPNLNAAIHQQIKFWPTSLQNYN